jgi:protease-4
VDALERDFYEERRRKWRRSAFWRGFWIAAILCLVIAVLTMGRSVVPVSDQIARYELSGIITDDVARDELLAELAETEAVRAVVLRINSPGGTTAGSEALFASIREIAEFKPVVAVLGEVAASGGYVAAIAADHVVARGNTLTGSIGVILEYPDLSGLIARFGVEMETIRSSPLKGEPSPLRPSNPQAREVEEALIADSYAWFRGLVAERRGIEGPALDAAANGQVFTGRLALERGLVDEIGGEREGLAWLESTDPGLAELPVEDWMVERERGVIGSILGSAGPSGGILGEISRFLGPRLYSLGL